MAQFSATHALGAGWRTYEKRPFYLTGVLVLAVIVVAVISAAIQEIGKGGAALALVAILVQFAFQTLYKIGQTNFLLHAERDLDTAEPKDFWHPKPFWEFLLASVLVFIIMFVAFVVCVLIALLIGALALLVHAASPALAFGGVFGVSLLILALIVLIPIGISLLFVRYLIVDRELHAVAALKHSVRIVRGKRWHLLLLLLLIALINLLGLICLVVGLLVTIPVTALTLVHAYRMLENHAA